MTSIIDLIVGTEAHGPSSGCWRYTLDVTPLKNIAVTNIFSISPKIIDTLGIDYETDSAVNVVGGASMKLNNAAVRLDMKAKTASDIVNWQPQSNLTYPLFKSASKVRLTSFMRTSIDLSISVLNAQLQDLATLTSETVFDARTLDLLIAGREPTKVSYACLQIATGTVTASVYGSTSTTYSGVSTSTVTQTVGEQGPLAIETELWRQSLATEVTATKGVVTSTKAGSRPLQTQLSCFTLTSHGRPHIEGKALGFQQGGDFLSLGYRIIEPAVFFLTSNGTLVAYPEPSTPGSQEPRVLCGPGSPDWVSFYKLWYPARYPSERRAVCSRDCGSQTLTCANGVGGNNAMNVFDPDPERDWYSEYKSDQPYMPQWVTGEEPYQTYPVELRWKEVQSPCQY
ncbi:hypothetical protein H2199_005610 [Coniosporium tulheliwenetii]|uniref:Uncharacterized protein n=1 Tax=Coniosporium tulheliwenetii TaxID=3383036 RepID=A0ACC2YZX0_9PEZI|nr:hypothetical protein H2199_005610 [Cladosporium sp. JES 115]